MRHFLSILALTPVATASQAQQIVRVGTYQGDSFIYGVDGWSATGYVNVEWSGYATPSYGNAGWRVVVWDTTQPQGPIASETYHASGYSGTYSRTFAVPAYHAVRVELYAVGDQDSRSANLSSVVTNSMWVQPITTEVGTSYAYPTNPTTYNYNNLANYSSPAINQIPSYNNSVTYLTSPIWSSGNSLVAGYSR